MRAASPRVTIGVPIYNAERFVEEALDALRAQDLEELEIIISDNGSTDGTEAICRRVAAVDDRITYLRSDVNRGLAWNHNRVVDAATAPYFKWAAYDDLHDPTFVSRCVAVLDERPDVVCASTGTVDIDEAGRIVRSWPTLHLACQDTPSARFHDMVVRLSKCFVVYGVMRTDVVRRTGLMGAYPSSDQTFLAELALHGRFHEIEEPLFLHREHADRSMTAFPTARARMAFFDPSRAGRPGFPRWRMGWELVKAVQRAPLPPDERLRCLAQLGPYAVRWRRSLAYNLAGAARDAAGGALASVGRSRGA